MLDHERKLGENNCFIAMCIEHVHVQPCGQMNYLFFFGKQYKFCKSARTDAPRKNAFLHTL